MRTREAEKVMGIMIEHMGRGGWLKKWCAMEGGYHDFDIIGALIAGRQFAEEKKYRVNDEGAEIEHILCSLLHYAEHLGDGGLDGAKHNTHPFSVAGGKTLDVVLACAIYRERYLRSTNSKKETQPRGK